MNGCYLFRGLVFCFVLGFVLFFGMGFFGFFFESSFSGERRRDQIFTGSSLAPLVFAGLDQMQLLHKFSIF